MEEPWQTIVEIIIYIIAAIVVIPYIPSLFETDDSPIIEEEEPEERVYRILKYTITIKKDKEETQENIGR